MFDGRVEEMLDSSSEVCVETLTTNSLVKVMFSYLVTVYSSLYFPIAKLVPLLIFLMMFDFVLGVWRAARENRLSSKGFRKGFFKILLYFFGITVICIFTAAFKEMFGVSLNIDVFSVGFLCANETLSCLAHLSVLGFPVPQWLVEKLQAFHDDPYQFMQGIKKK